jgi:hypothetical protein
MNAQVVGPVQPPKNERQRILGEKKRIRGKDTKKQHVDRYRRWFQK